MTEECGASVPAAKGTPSIFRSVLLTTLKRICICSPYYSPLPFAASMLAATPFPHGSGANLAVAGFVVGTLSDRLLPSGCSSYGTCHGRRDSFERVLLSINNHFNSFQFAAATIKPRPAPPHAGRYTVASRFRCRSCERGYIFQGLQNSSLAPRSAL